VTNAHADGLAGDEGAAREGCVSCAATCRAQIGVFGFPTSLEVAKSDMAASADPAVEAERRARIEARNALFMRLRATWPALFAAKKPARTNETSRIYA
jgi:hypothetical protein